MQTQDLRTQLAGQGHRYLRDCGRARQRQRANPVRSAEIAIAPESTACTTAAPTASALSRAKGGSHVRIAWRQWSTRHWAPWNPIAYDVRRPRSPGACALEPLAGAAASRCREAAASAARPGPTLIDADRLRTAFAALLRAKPAAVGSDRGRSVGTATPAHDSARRQTNDPSPRPPAARAPRGNPQGAARDGRRLDECSSSVQHCACIGRNGTVRYSAVICRQARNAALYPLPLRAPDRSTTASSSRHPRIDQREAINHRRPRASAEASTCPPEQRWVHWQPLFSRQATAETSAVTPNATKLRSHRRIEAGSGRRLHVPECRYARRPASLAASPRGAERPRRARSGTIDTRASQLQHCPTDFGEVASAAPAPQ